MDGPDTPSSTGTSPQRWTDAHRFVIAELGDRACHDLNNKLTIMIGNLGLLMRRQQDAEGRDLAGNALDATRGCAAMVAHMLAFSRTPETEPEETDVSEVIGSLERTLAGLLGTRGRLAVNLPNVTGWHARLDRRGLELTLTALALFGARRLSESGTIEIALDHGDGQNSPTIRLTVAVTPVDGGDVSQLDAEDPRQSPDLVLVAEFARRSRGRVDTRLAGERMEVILELPAYA